MSEEMQVSLREKWANEAWDFTPWLAEHLDQLGETIGLNLEFIQTEYQVGNFSLDILANTWEGNPAKPWEGNKKVLVAIENQLEWTDHGHLGQLVLYASGARAGIAIWVASEFQYEHAEALDKLNKWADGTIKFYGVKVDVLHNKSDNKTRADLKLVVAPGNWDKSNTLSPSRPPNPEIDKHRRFFSPIVYRVLEDGFAESFQQVWSFRDRFFPSGFDRYIGYGISLEERGEAWVYLLIRDWDSVDISNGLFERLKGDCEQIQSSVGNQWDWHWDKYEKFYFATIGVSIDGSIDASPEDQETSRAWMLELLPKFKAAFEERTARLLAELRQ